ncbi:MAG: hypothetical protein ACERKZ_02375 [Lachnotalea sp.]
MNKKNSEGYSDPTATQAIATISKEEKVIHTLTHTIKDLVRLAGFEVVGRIEFIHKESGRHYK